MGRCSGYMPVHFNLCTTRSKPDTNICSTSHGSNYHDSKTVCRKFPQQLLPRQPSRTSVRAAPVLSVARRPLSATGQPPGRWRWSVYSFCTTCDRVGPGRRYWIRVLSVSGAICPWLSPQRRRPGLQPTGTRVRAGCLPSPGAADGGLPGLIAAGTTRAGRLPTRDTATGSTAAAVRH